MIEYTIQFKEPKLELEFPKLDNRLRFIVYALVGYTYFNFGKKLLITEVFRTQEMQDEYYKDNPDYKEQPWYSTHQFYRAVDISLKYYTEEEIKNINDFINLQLPYTKQGNLKTALIHDIGLGNHLHLQVNSSGVSEIVKLT